MCRTCHTCKYCTRDYFQNGLTYYYGDTAYCKLTNKEIEDIPYETPVCNMYEEKNPDLEKILTEEIEAYF